MDTISHLLNFRIALTLNWVQVDEELIRRGFLHNGISLALDGSQDHLYSLSDDLVRQHLQGILSTTGRGGIAKTCTPRGLLCYVSTLEPACSTAWPRAYNETTLPTNWSGRGRNPIQLSNSFEGAG